MGTVVTVAVGVVLLVIAVTQNLPLWVDQLSRYIISAGVFGLATGGTNAMAVLMLLYKLPLVCGSGYVGKPYVTTFCFVCFQGVLSAASPNQECHSTNSPAATLQFRASTELHLQKDPSVFISCTGHREHYQGT